MAADVCANSIPTPNNGNACGFSGTGCNWTLASRTGAVTVIAAIFDRDLKGTPANASDDTMTIIGWAYKTAITVDKGVNQTGLALAQIEAGNMQNVSIDYGTPPAALSSTGALVGIELANSEVIQLPVFAQTTQSSVLAPKPSVFAATAYRLTAVAQTSSGNMGAQSILIRHDLTGPTLSAGSWLAPPTGVTISRTHAEFSAIASANIGSVQWSDSNGVILELTTLDGSTSVDVPALVALPSTGTLTAKAQGIGADIDTHEFSLDLDRNKLWGVAAEPATIQ